MRGLIQILSYQESCSSEYVLTYVLSKLVKVLKTISCSRKSQNLARKVLLGQVGTSGWIPQKQIPCYLYLQKPVPFFCSFLRLSPPRILVLTSGPLLAHYHPPSLSGEPLGVPERVGDG